jgi:mono/diheme cytochrome c family protein
MTLTRRLFLVAVALGAAGAAVFWILTIPQTVAASAVPAHVPDLANGELMFNAGDCSGCHTGRDKDGKRLSGGGGLKTPFGVFYIPNISPDPTDGIGAWTEAQFITAMVKGTSPDGRHYYPAFPYPSFAQMRISDLQDLFAYLKTLPAVTGRAREHDLSFPFNIRRGLGLWKLLFLDRGPFRPDPTKSAAWNRGAYLVNGPAHCAECHSPRNFMGGIIASERFAGGPNPEGEGWIPNITQKRFGDWTEDDFATLLETGETPEPDMVSGAMAVVVESTARLPAADRVAMATYLKSLPSVDGPTPPVAK